MFVHFIHPNYSLLGIDVATSLLSDLVFDQNHIAAITKCHLCFVGPLELSRRKKTRSDSIFELILNGLPNLRRLNCRSCGAGVLLRKTEAFCPHCHAHGPLPEDYVEAVSLKSHVTGLLKSAINHLRVANIATNPLLGWTFFLMIFIEPLVLFPTIIIGSNVFSDTWFDRAFEKLGETTTLLLMIQATCALFGAMEILDEFVGTFTFVSVILVGASILLSVIYAIKNLV